MGGTAHNIENIPDSGELRNGVRLMGCQQIAVHTMLTTNNINILLSEQLPAHNLRIRSCKSIFVAIFPLGRTKKCLALEV